MKQTLNINQTSKSAVTARPVKQNDGQLEHEEIRKLPWHAAILCRCGIHRGTWFYLTDGNCTQIKICKYCGKILERIKHQREWRYVRNGCCDQNKVCKRCADIDKHRIHHQWGPTYSSGGQSAHDCSRCGQTESWQESDYSD